MIFDILKCYKRSIVYFREHGLLWSPNMKIKSIITKATILTQTQVGLTQLSLSLLKICLTLNSLIHNIINN